MATSPKPMNKVLKFILAAGGALALLTLVGMIGVAAYVHVKYPPEKLKSLATEKLSEVLKHKVSVTDVNFNMLTGFKITGLKINNRLGWSDTPLVVAKDISISYHLFELVMGYFSGQVSLGEIRLDQPQILIERRGLNQFNFSDMAGGAQPTAAEPAPVSQAKPKAVGKSKAKAKPKKKKKPKAHAALVVPNEAPAASSFFADTAWADSPSSPHPPSSKASVLISVDSINITHGKMVYLDETTSPAQRSDLKDLNLKIKNISMVGGKTTFSLETPFTYSKMDYRLAVEGTFRYYLSTQSLKDLSISGKVNDLGFQVSGDVQNMTGDFTPNLDGEASLNMLKFSGLLPKSLTAMPEGLSLTGPAKVSFHFGGSSQKGLQLKGVADGADLAIQYKDLFIKAAKTTCKLEFTSVMGQNYYELPTFHATFQDWELDGSFHYQNDSYYSCVLRSKSLPLKGLSKVVPKFNKAAFSGDASLNLKLSQRLGKPLSLNMDGQMALKGIGVTLPEDPDLFQDFRGTIVMKGAVVKMTDATFKTFKGTGAASMLFNLGVNPMAYSYAFSLKNVSAQETVNGWVDVAVTKNPKDLKDKLFGNMNFNYQGSGRGTTSAEMEASAAGSGTYSITSAKVKGLAVIKAINKYFKDSSDEISFEQITGNLGMKNKVFSYAANTVGKVGAFREMGAINIVNMVYAPDMKVQCDIKKEFLNSDGVVSGLPEGVRGLVKNPDWLADDKGNIPVDVKFTGPVKDNNWSYDWSRLTQNLRNWAAKQVQKAAQEVIQNGAQDLGNKLKGLFGK